MTTTAAQDEFNELMRDKGREDRHPEDRHDDSDHSEPDSPGAADDYLEKIDTDDELDLPRDMRSNNYYMPSLRSEANTGPKGVIADAQAFEQAKKQAKRFTWKKTQSEQPQYNVTAWHDKDASSEEDGEDSFMKEWRAARLRELQNVGQRIRSRTNSPSRRVYGNFPLVDAEGYLDALDKSSPETTVVVFVYSNEVCSQSDNACVQPLTISRRVSQQRSRRAWPKWPSATTPFASSSSTTTMPRWRKLAFPPCWPTSAARRLLAWCHYSTHSRMTRSLVPSALRRPSGGESYQHRSETEH
jgi:hypothetical protein